MAQISLRVDDTLKAKAENICASMGMNMTTAINIYLTKLVNERRIPFEITADPFYSDENMAELERRVTEIKNGIAVLKEHELIEDDE